MSRSPRSFALGDVVQVVGLVNTPHRNGLVGVVFRCKADCGGVGDKLAVQVLLQPTKIEVQAKNLVLVDVSDWDLPTHQADGQCAADSAGAYSHPAAAFASSDDILGAVLSASTAPFASAPAPAPTTTASQFAATGASAATPSTQRPLLQPLLFSTSPTSPASSNNISSSGSSFSAVSSSAPGSASSAPTAAAPAPPPAAGVGAFKAKTSVFDDPTVIKVLGGAQAVASLRLKFEAPLRANPRDPAANLNFASLVLSTAVGSRASGVFMQKFVEHEEVRSCSLLLRGLL
jgi:hypothetical protein